MITATAAGKTPVLADPHGLPDEAGIIGIYMTQHMVGIERVQSDFQVLALVD